MLGSGAPCRTLSRRSPSLRAGCGVDMPPCRSLPLTILGMDMSTVEPTHPVRGRLVRDWARIVTWCNAPSPC